MDDPGTFGLIFKIILLVFFILVDAFYELTESAIISLNTGVIDDMAKQGDKKAKRVQKVLKNLNNFIINSQVCITFTCFITSAIAIQSFGTMLIDAVADVLTNLPLWFVTAISIMVITIIVSFVSLVFGKFIPKRIAKHIPEKVAFAFASSLLFTGIIVRPFSKIVSSISNVFVKLFGFDPHATPESVTEEKIRMMVDVGEEKGVIENTQKEMINNIFKFDDVCVENIMTHRTDIISVEDNAPLSEVVSLAIEHGYSRIPVYEEDIDNIIGVIYIKDLLKYVGENVPKSKKMKDIMHPAFYVPESRNCNKLFKDLNEKHIQIAIVVDEYGGTAGIVTLEDLLELIVGNIQDEYDNEDEPFFKINDKCYILDGSADIENISEELNIEIPQGDYDTLGGFIITLLGYLPKQDDRHEVDYNNVHFTVLDIKDRRISKVRADIKEPKLEELEEEN